jgi:hypothetical protein
MASPLAISISPARFAKHRGVVGVEEVAEVAEVVLGRPRKSQGRSGAWPCL